MPHIRYKVSRFDLDTFVVYDAVRHAEVCVCGNIEDQTDAELRAKHIAALLNENCIPKAPHLKLAKKK